MQSVMSSINFIMIILHAGMCILLFISGFSIRIGNRRKKLQRVHYQLDCMWAFCFSKCVYVCAFVFYSHAVSAHQLRNDQILAECFPDTIFDLVWISVLKMLYTFLLYTQHENLSHQTAYNMIALKCMLFFKQQKSL